MDMEGNDSLCDLGARLTDNHWPPCTPISKFKKEKKIKHKTLGGRQPIRKSPT